MNVLDFILIVIFIASFIKGYKVGLIRQLLKFIGFFIALYFAYQFSNALAIYLQAIIPPSSGNGYLQNIFYNAIAFFLIFIAVKVILHFVGFVLDGITIIPGIATLNRLFGSLIGLVQAILITIILIHVILIMPWEKLHFYINTSLISNYLIDYTPIIREKLYELWKGTNTTI